MTASMADPFVGRAECLEEFKGAWNEAYRIFGIYGPKSVGKTCYVENFLRSLKTSDKHDEPKIINLDFHHISNFAVYVQTIAKWFEISGHDTDAHLIQEIARLLKSSDHGYIFHHDHQEEAKSKPDSDGNLPESTQQCLWDQIYAKIIKPLIKECNNFRLIISSTDEFLFASFRGVFWKQKIPELVESDSLELLTTVWPSAASEEESCKHIVRLCDGIPPAIINAGLLLNERVISVEEVIKLMMEQVIDVLSDECLPNSEKISAQLLDRWGHLSKDHCDNLVKIVIIIKNTSQSTISATSKLCKYESVAEYKFKCLLPLLRRNLICYNTDNERVSLSPLIQHILDAVEYIKAEDLRGELRERIKAILEVQPRNDSECRVSEHSDSNSLPYSDCVNFYSSKERRLDLQSSSSMKPPKEPTESHNLQENEDPRLRHTSKNSPKVPVENESDDSNDLNGQTDTQNTQHSFAQNLNRKSLENEKNYSKKGIGNSRQSSDDENLPLTNSRQSSDDENFPLTNSRQSSDDENLPLTKDSGNSAMTVSGKQQATMDKYQLIPVVTLSGEHEIRSKDKPVSASCFEGNISHSIACGVEVCTDVTTSGTNSVTNSEIHRRNSKDSENRIPESKKISSEEATVPKTVSMFPIQVSEESGSFKKDNLSCPESQPNALPYSINNDLKSYNPTDSPTCTRNAGLTIHEIPSSAEEFRDSDQNHRGFNDLNYKCDDQAHQRFCQCSEDHLDTNYQPASNLQTPTPNSHTESPEVHSSGELPKVNGRISPSMVECLHENDSNTLKTCINQTRNVTASSEKEARDCPSSRYFDTSRSDSILSTIVDMCKSLE